jgi:hypothetical protein
MAIDWKNYTVEESETDSNWPEKGQQLRVGDSIEGRYVAKKTNVGINKSNIYVLETNEGQKVGVWGGTVLDNKFQSIAIGKMVAIEYVGDRQGKSGGKPYHDFKVGTGVDYVGDGTEAVPFE